MPEPPWTAEEEVAVVDDAWVVVGWEVVGF